MQGPWVATQDGAQWFIGAPVSDTLPAHAARHIGNAYNEANARLIAAAPQMRTALDSMVLNYAQSGRVTDEFVRDVARMLLEIDQ
jgi:hypothetical protein